MFYIIPAKKIYFVDPNTKEERLVGIEPEITLTGKWVGDCKDGKTYLVKTNLEIPGYIPATDNEITTLGFDLTQVNNWNGGW